MEKQPNSRMCFICGRQNPVGLHLDFYEDHDSDPKQVYAEIVIPDAYQGYPGVVHGGIVSAILDEASGRAVMIDAGDDRLMATLKMTVRFRHPTPTGTRLTAVGWVEQLGDIGAKVAAEIRLPDGTVTAECESLLVDPPAVIRDQWEDEKPYWKVYD